MANTYRVTAKDARGVTYSTGNLPREEADKLAEELRAEREQLPLRLVPKWTVTVEQDED